MADLILNIDELEIDCPDIIGLSTALRFYKFAWQIQQMRVFDIYRSDDVPNEVVGGKHPSYLLRHLELGTEFMLVRNKGELGHFAKKFKDLDFFFFSINPEIEVDNEILMAFKQMNGVSLCYNLKKIDYPDNINFIQFI